MRLTDYQRGSIFGLVIACVAFGFACWPSSNNKPTDQQTGLQTSAHTENNREHKIARWWRWTVSADSSGFYTFGLILVGAAQAGFFIWQLDLIRRGLTDTEKASKAAQDSADIARLALEAAETPYLIAIVEAYKPESADYTDTRFPGQTLKTRLEQPDALVSYTLKNCGRSPAIILEIYQGLIASKNIPLPISFPPPQTNLFVNSIMEAGSVSSPRRFWNGAVRDDWTPADQTRVAWMLGQVRYADVFGNQFVTGFCSYRNVHNGTWILIGGPAYNFRRKLTKEETTLAIARDSLPGHAN